MAITSVEELTEADFKRALLAIRRPIADHHMELLRVYYRAPEHTMTATQLAEALDYANHSAVNLHYGGFADRICSVIGLRPEIRLTVLVTDYKPNDDQREHLRLVLRPQFVQALGELSWFEPR